MRVCARRVPVSRRVFLGLGSRRVSDRNAVPTSSAATLYILLRSPPPPPYIFHDAHTHARIVSVLRARYTRRCTPRSGAAPSPRKYPNAVSRVLRTLRVKKYVVEKLVPSARAGISLGAKTVSKTKTSDRRDSGGATTFFTHSVLLFLSERQATVMRIPPPPPRAVFITLSLNFFCHIYQSDAAYRDDMVFNPKIGL